MRENTLVLPENGWKRLLGVSRLMRRYARLDKCNVVPVKDGLAARRFVVSGKVQGVFFRASTARAAEQLRLRGHAHNLAEGRVEVLAVGSAASLESLARWLWIGPPLAQV